MRHVWTPEARFRAIEANRRRWREMSPEERKAEGLKISIRLRRPVQYCRVSECEYAAVTRELCEAHYRQLLRHGRVNKINVSRWPGHTPEKSVQRLTRKRSHK